MSTQTQTIEQEHGDLIGPEFDTIDNTPVITVHCEVCPATATDTVMTLKRAGWDFFNGEWCPLHIF